MKQRLLLTSQGLPEELEDVFLKCLNKPPVDTSVSFVITAAYGDYKDPTWLDFYRKQLRGYGIKDIEDLDFRDKNKRQLEETLRGKDAIFVNGGNTCFLLYYIRKCGFDKLLKPLLRQGKLYIGISAGSIVVGPNIKFGKRTLDRNKIGLKDFTGLNLVPLTIYPHYKRKDYQKIKKGAKELPYPTIALNDTQAVLVEDSKWKIVGKGKKMIFNIFSKIKMDMENKRLNCKTVVEIIPTSPFDFDSTFHKPDHFPSNDNAWEPGIKRQTMIWQGEKLGLKIVNAGSKTKPSLAVAVHSNNGLSRGYLESLKEELIYRYSLDLDLREFNRKFKNDPHLRSIIKKWQGMRPMHYSSLYEHLIIMIMLQNCTVRRSVNMLQALFENYGTLLEYDDKRLWSYWQPQDLENVSEDELRKLKIGYRAKFIKRISEQFTKGEIDEFELRKLPREKQKEKLLTLYGIGPASVHNLLWEVFKHYDLLVKISPWEQKIYSKLFFNKDADSPVSEKKLLEFFKKRFGEYQMLAIHYIWEDLWWRRKHEHIPWLEKLIRL